MGANFSKLDDAISCAAYDDQELKDMHDIIANNTESFESVITKKISGMICLLFSLELLKDALLTCGSLLGVFLRDDFIGKKGKTPDKSDPVLQFYKCYKRTVRSDCKSCGHHQRCSR
jgi:hypothetical protein